MISANRPYKIDDVQLRRCPASFLAVPGSLLAVIFCLLAVACGSSSRPASSQQADAARARALSLTLADFSTGWSLHTKYAAPPVGEDCFGGLIDSAQLGIPVPVCAGSGEYWLRGGRVRSYSLSAVFANDADAQQAEASISLDRLAREITSGASSAADSEMSVVSKSIRPLEVKTEEASARAVRATVTFKSNVQNVTEGAEVAMTADFVLLRNGREVVLVALVGRSVPATELPRLVARIEGKLIGRQLVPPTKAPKAATAKERSDFLAWRSGFETVGPKLLEAGKLQQLATKEVQKKSPNVAKLRSQSKRLSDLFAEIARDIDRIHSAPTPYYARVNLRLWEAARLLSEGYDDWYRGLETGDQAVLSEGDRKIKQGTQQYLGTFDEVSRIASKLGETF
jgi:hypothetical protein